jgi:hypothetical protein
VTGLLQGNAAWQTSQVLMKGNLLPLNPVRHFRSMPAPNLTGGSFNGFFLFISGYIYF